MKKTLLFSGILLALTASLALAGGINFNYGDCSAGAATYLKTFGCTSNALSGVTMIGSFQPSAPQPGFSGIEVVIDLQSSSASLPDWWQFYNAGSCRTTALSVNAVGSTSCLDPWAGQAFGGIGAYQTTTTSPPVPNGLPNAARLKIGYALAVPVPLDPIEYYGFSAAITGAKTVGTGACAGCATPVQVVLNEIKSAEAMSFERITAPILNTCLSWQTRDGAICNATPARNATWGQVKSLYR